MPSFTEPRSQSLKKFTPNKNEWRFGWPNSADQNFNFYKLMEDTKLSGVGRITSGEAPRVAVIGAGIAGLTVASELFRSGFNSIDIFEASPRIGGRDYSLAVPGVTPIAQTTAYEMGAMRFPFFTEPADPNSVMKYYADTYGITTQAFPDPGTVRTGIYVNNGYGPDPDNPLDKPTMLIWNPTDGKPPTRTLQTIFDRWETFSKMVEDVFAPVYIEGDTDWTALWHAVANHYSNLNFRQMAQLPVLESYNPDDKGYFGGLGFTNDQLETFYLIGAGDGSWGAFFDVSSLYIFRTLLCGFGTNHQLIQGRFLNGKLNPGPEYSADPTARLAFSGDTDVEAPHYLGVQSFSECALYLPQQPRGISLYQAVTDPPSGVSIDIFSTTKVIELADGEAGRKFALTYSKELQFGDVETREYDIVVMTPTTWASQTSIDMGKLSADRLPFRTRTAMNTAHWIKSCKICAPLTKNYWSGDDPVMPQVMITDSFLQDVYAYASVGDDLGVVVLSYTWEDDASKFLAGPSSDIIIKCLEEANRITMQTLGVKISDYIDANQSRIIRWALEPTYHGCAKLYREGSWIENYDLLAFNQKQGKNTGLYVAGEAFSVEGGWTEPAMRLALDAVVNIINDTENAEFNADFDYSNYLQLDTDFIPKPLNPFGG
ncbi:MAG: FAD-dependent oxidoreductase [Rhodospirillaceae bacterium]|nr:FAD-dependent oxidoreductase [Rhodospirillaceae bacterium]